MIFVELSATMVASASCDNLEERDTRKCTCSGFAYFLSFPGAFQELKEDDECYQNKMGVKIVVLNFHDGSFYTRYSANKVIR